LILSYSGTIALLIADPEEIFKQNEVEDEKV